MIEKIFPDPFITQGLFGMLNPRDLGKARFLSDMLKQRGDTVRFMFEIMLRNIS